MLELRILSPQEDGFVREIKWNKEEIVAAVDTMIADYRGLVYTGETIKEAKSDRAKLNKLLDAFESERKRLKKLCEVPYKQFEADVKQVTDLIREPIGLIDAQIKEVEEAKRAEKKAKVWEYYDTHVEGLRGILPFEKVYKPEYLNATKSMKSIETEIEGLFARVNSDLDTIESLKTKYEFQVKDVYIRTLDLPQALRENARLEEVAARLEEQRKAAEREKKQQEEAKAEIEAYFQAAYEKAPFRVVPGHWPDFQSKAEVDQWFAMHEKMAQTAKEAYVEEEEGRKEQAVLPEEEKRYVVGLQIYGTRQELVAFQNFLVEHEIRYDVTMKAKEEV